MGFEPMCPVKDNTISNRARYDRFDTSPQIHICKYNILYIKSQLPKIINLCIKYRFEGKMLIPHKHKNRFCGFTPLEETAYTHISVRCFTFVILVHKLKYCHFCGIASTRSKLINSCISTVTLCILWSYL